MQTNYLYQIGLLETELFDHLTVRKQMLLLQSNTWNHLILWKKNELRLVWKFYQQNVYSSYLFDKWH